MNPHAVVADEADVHNRPTAQWPPGFVMRSMLSATLMVVTVRTAQAKMSPPSTVGAKKTIATVPVCPALQKPEETAKRSSA